MAVEEHPNWRKKFPTGPVHWDVTCDSCKKFIGTFPPAGEIHGKMYHGIAFSPNDYGGIGCCLRKNGEWLCKTCAPIANYQPSE